MTLRGAAQILHCAEKVPDITPEAAKLGLGLLNLAAKEIEPSFPLYKYVSKPWQDSPDSGEGKKVCVTGASSFFGTHLVQQLLQRKYQVVAVAGDAEAALKSLPSAENLQLVSAIGEKEVSGAETVFATDVLDAGLLDLLAACSKESSVKKVVVTSSIAASASEAGPMGEWAPETVPQSKAEQSCFEAAQTGSWKLATIQPGLLLGPSLGPNPGEGAQWLASLSDGSHSQVPRGVQALTAAQDAARAHVLVSETEAAEGRFPCVGQVMTYDHICAVIRRAQPSAKVPSELEDKDQEPVVTWKNSRLVDGGLSFCSMVGTIMGCCPAAPAAAASETTTAAAPAEQTNEVTVDPAKEEELKALFDTFDVDGTGFMGKEDFKAFYSDANKTEADAGKLDALLAECKDGGATQISFQEFTRLMLNSPQYR
jgi:cinnamoyl-CoA reductase|mmetsp:Transcript_18258/g.30247  ORF Transcript_18258/g.30247 Transcript_18258/m.30247 type:complete len:426 (+) Transcript_18258:82-1359(+)|eukprot:CAMPEP_0174300618 /NCGR_PEP_ID=MMETSP0809-20121228/58562_1 /TAXON_ID=73025 ORGANISM="Eutreptiella gymnastica-like, Strain CCMP1594" /NCGR_SAMPLE_ID=MMETSP0809 /ASSEMBLY_ACC=CAM_ASM_000658 /LENGTH=425 /DNA_ID=CAMNT_0015406227 /DNA_START=34 /DNA_END=1311 /DNA_ORIENTATION=-